MAIRHFQQRFILATAALLLLSVSSAADVVVDWNAIAVDAPPPAVVGPAHARILGYVHAAVYDAVNGIDRRYAPYAVTFGSSRCFGGSSRCRGSTRRLDATLPCAAGYARCSTSQIAASDPGRNSEN